MVPGFTAACGLMLVGLAYGFRGVIIAGGWLSVMGGLVSLAALGFEHLEGGIAEVTREIPRGATRSSAGSGNWPCRDCCCSGPAVWLQGVGVGHGGPRGALPVGCCLQCWPQC